MIEDVERRLTLRELYEATEYWVDDAPCGAFSISCGERSLALDRLLTDTGLNDWVYITACNPGSHPLSAEDNTSRMLDLEARLRTRPCVFYHGRGVGTIGDWPPEPSLLVLGVREEQGLELGRTYGQAAIVVGRLGEPARLAWPGAVSGE